MIPTEEIRTAVLAGKPFCLPGSKYDYTVQKNELHVSNGTHIISRVEIEKIHREFLVCDDRYLPDNTGIIPFKKCDLKQPINSML